jgi:abequosyltransferase
MKPLLSILITTYNRAYFLVKLLNSIVENCNFFDKVEVVVFNNGSTDNTQQIIEEFKNRIPSLRIAKVKNTIDFTGGFFKLAEMGKGKYFWYIGDYDFITESINNLILYLEKEEPDIILLNHFFYIQDSKDVQKKIIDKKDFLFNKKKTFFFDNYKDFIKRIKHINGFFTHIATCIFKKDKFKSLISSELIEKYRISKSHHIFLFLSTLKNSNNITYFHEQLICLRIGAPINEWATLEGRIERIRMGTKFFVDMVIDVFEEKEIINHFKNLILKNDIFVLIIGAKLKMAESNISYFYMIFKMLRKDYWKFPFFWYCIFPLCFTPSIILKLLYNAYLKLK